MEEFNSIFAKLVSAAKSSDQLGNGTESLEQSTNLEAALLRHAKDIQMTANAEAKNIDIWTRLKHFVDNRSLQHPIPPFDDLRPQDRLEVSDLASTPDQVLWGKYLLCQTISPASKSLGFKLVVTDPKGTSGVELVLYNYSAVEESVLDVDIDDILPPGSFLVLKNPRFKPNAGRFMLLCDNPAEVEIVSRKRVETKFPDLEWNVEVEKLTMEIMEFFQKRYFWKDLENDAAAFSKLKGLGNKGFVNKRFSDAVRFYDMALDYCKENREEEATIISNKSAALLGLGCYNAALKCAEAALEVDPSNEKYNYRKTKALIGLKKYEEGLSFLGAQFDQFASLSKNKDCKTLMDVVKFLCSREKLGLTESQLLSLRKATLKKDDNIPEFFGPLAVSQIEGKGRGLIATQDIHPGQLLICDKAFCYHNPPPSSAQSLGNNALFESAGKIANKLTFDPELGPEFYNLTGGSELGHLESGDWRNGQVDMKRISEILKTNSFATGTGTIKKPGEPAGLWILPSLLNHSCSEFNAVSDICEEWLTITATAEIKKGEEVRVPYVKPISNYYERQLICKSHGFSCSCSLCQLDSSEPIAVKNEREKILQSLAELPLDCGPLKIKKALKDVEKLVSLRKHNVALNYPILYPEIFRLEQILIKKGRLGDNIWLLSRMQEVAAASACWCLEGILVALSLTCCHGARGDKKLMMEWSATVKRLAVTMYGSLEASGISFGPLKEQFGIDLFE